MSKPEAIVREGDTVFVHGRRARGDKSYSEGTVIRVGRTLCDIRTDSGTGSFRLARWLGGSRHSPCPRR